MHNTHTIRHVVYVYNKIRRAVETKSKILNSIYSVLRPFRRETFKKQYKQSSFVLAASCAYVCSHVVWKRVNDSSTMVGNGRRDWGDGSGGGGGGGNDLSVVAGGGGGGKTGGLWYTDIIELLVQYWRNNRGCCSQFMILCRRCSSRDSRFAFITVHNYLYYSFSYFFTVYTAVSFYFSSQYFRLKV